MAYTAYPLICILIFTLALTKPVVADLPKTGNITLFSGSACVKPLYINSFILGIDHCGVDPNTVESFVLNERPWCVNGSRPHFNIYTDTACASLAKSFEPGPLYNPTGPDADGTCVAAGGFRAMAFICDGLAVVASPSSKTTVSAGSTSSVAQIQTTSPVAGTVTSGGLVTPTGTSMSSASVSSAASAQGTLATTTATSSTGAATSSTPAVVTSGVQARTGMPRAVIAIVPWVLAVGSFW